MKLDMRVSNCRRRSERCGMHAIGVAAALVSLSAAACGDVDFGEDQPDAGSSADAGAPGPKLVQSNSGKVVLKRNLPVSALVVTLGPTHPGNLLIVTVADTGGGTEPVHAGVMYSCPVSSIMYNNAGFCFGAIPDGFDGRVQLDPTRFPDNGDEEALRMIVMEWSGLAAVPADPRELTDGTGSASGMTAVASATTTATTATSSAPDLLLFDVSADQPFPADAPPGWTNIATVTAEQNSTENAWYKVTSASGLQGASVSVQGSTQWDAVIAAFKIAQ